MIVNVRPQLVEPAEKSDLVWTLPENWGARLLTFWLSLFALSSVWLMIDLSAIFVAAGALACAIVTLPLTVGRTYEVASPWTLVVAGAYLGYGLRGLFISLGIEGARSLDQLYFLGNSPSFFVRPSLLFILGLLLFTGGYMMGGRKRAESRRRRHPIGTVEHFDGTKLAMAVLGSAVLGFVGFLLYAQSTGGLSLGQLSAKRTVIDGIELEASYQSFGEYRVLNTFSFIAFWLQVAWYAHRRVPHGPFTRQGWWLGVLLLNAALLPIYASTRSDVVYILMSALLIEICLRGREVRRAGLVIPVVAAILLTGLLSALRNPDAAVEVGATNRAIPLSTGVLIDTFILTRTFADHPTTVNIVEAIPERLPYANGSTITAWLAAPIPRSVWPDKPLISSGPVLGRVIFGNTRSGVPPGMIAESYWNFGLSGLLAISFLCGLVIRRLGEYWAPYASVSPGAAVLLSVAAVRPGVDLMSNSVGFAPFTLLQTLVLLVPVILFVGSRRPSGRADTRGATRRATPVD